ncbi:substrate-binding periplasmic protein [Roseibium suaedae]|uniref:Amino acid ABC transporter substrate-binding protein, PAAT family n=1 Tax=Roseibium suaedae TaxID=735517 RepID=A0A1M7CPQ4_9HYPH|nr:transporter substrate-binding domain-containing protein [Roseibium suaedae]SHL69258.1 amino acid ABC transporter substrate-binding protein, PAAT family [Roseibium suaedae]
MTFIRLLSATVLSFTFLFLPFSASAKTWKTVRIGFEENFPPFSFIDSKGKLDGFDFKLAEALCSKMGVTCQYYTVTYDAAPVALTGIRDSSTNSYKREPQVDVLINSMTITERRKQFFAFSKPYYYLPHAILIRKESGIDIKGSKDTAGMKVGVVTDSDEMAYAQKYFREADLKTFYDLDSLKDAVKNREIEMALMDAASGYEWVDTDAGNCCKTNGHFRAMPDLSPGAGIAVRHEDTELLDMINAALTLIKGDGTYEKIRKQFFRFTLDAG